MTKVSDTKQSITNKNDKNIERQMTKRMSQTEPMTKLKLMTKMGK